MICVVFGDVKSKTGNVTTFQGSNEEPSNAEAGGILDEYLRPGDGAPEEHGNRKEALRAHVLANHVERQFGDDEADREESLGEVDIRVANVDVSSQRVGQGIADVGAIKLEETEAEYNGR